MKIRNVNLANPYILAPMAGVTDLPFRLYVKNRSRASLHGNDQCKSFAI